MMNRDFDLKLGNIIREKIPKSIKPANYLTEVFGISRESAYRRLKGTIPFTLEEVMKLATLLNFSIDDFLEKKLHKKTAVINIQNDRLENVEEGFIKMLNHHRENMRNIYESETNHTMMSANRVLTVFTCGLENLFKFGYYKWLHQFDKTPLNFSFSDLIVSDEINELRLECDFYSQNINLVLIIDKNIIYNTIKEINYFADRGLIETEEIKKLKKELNNYMDIIFITYPEGALKYDIYLSSLPIGNNLSYMNYDDKTSSYYWVNSENFIYTSDPRLCQSQKDWLQSLKKYSILISQSNQKIQAELHNIALKQLNELTK